MSITEIKSFLENCSAIIFDLDGVIADTEPLKFEAYRQVFQDVFSVELPAEDITWRGMKEASVINYWFTQLQLSGDSEQLIQAKRSTYQHLLEQGSIPPVKGVTQFIEKIKQGQKMCGLATSSSRNEANTILKHLRIDSFFDSLLSRDDVTNTKPNPEVYLTSASNLNTQPSQCLVFEDSQSGVSAAKAAGMMCVGLTTSFTQEELHKADWILPNFRELLD